ncbi:HpcH/HpaI aldolase/citrate lyase family protein [Nesterenkonia xinjiangensis]|uniref:Citrate lyase subunit beta/citryl-CoA lyase n=1 Tax=Nesterenkonia xinjiangensis TaxID=225327 RepID=A0A7Z0GL08_9MICC|nr:CoA ester lyase [Nesterenkonia xinjiangensis]NYJ77056.1 citrate lyase subunit beta/citryl-CoA lyase [Nesterenkonia xinjiangensis]
MSRRRGFTVGPSLLFCPADRPERYAKAADRADALILDLEDAVADRDKPHARRHLRQHLQTLAAPETAELRARTVVRINPAGTPGFAADVDLLAGTGVELVMLAKTESREEVDAAARALPDAGIIGLCETAAGVTRAEQIASHPQVVALMWGAEDLLASIGGSSSRRPDGRYRDVARQARAQVLLAAATHGAAGIDAIYADIEDTDGLAAEAADAAASGWTAKACIHPAQVPVIRSAYAPTEQELDHARALLAEVPHHGGAFRFRGSMVDLPLVRHAEQVVRRAEAAAQSLR